jgi:two-component system alkaline phosphatase synthesis response regulator PhoP
LVEDDPPTSSALRTILGRMGWEVRVAGSLADAYRLLDEPYDWVVLDLMLPDGDGLDVLRKIRREGLPIRVAITTGSSDDDLLADVILLQPELFLSKPIDLRELVHGLNQGA